MGGCVSGDTATIGENLDVKQMDLKRNKKASGPPR